MYRIYIYIYIYAYIYIYLTFMLHLVVHQQLKHSILVIGSTTSQNQVLLPNQWVKSPSLRGSGSPLCSSRASFIGKGWEITVNHALGPSNRRAPNRWESHTFIYWVSPTMTSWRIITKFSWDKNYYNWLSLTPTNHHYCIIDYISLN